MPKIYDEQNNVKSNCYGFGSHAVNFIYVMTKLRYKKGNGDPAGFSAPGKYCNCAKCWE